MNQKFNKWIARILMVTLVNPAMFISPVFAKDTEIFSGLLSSSAVSVKPNILFVLDTSDSMNLPEAWREMGETETEYDSHVEYLWNDLALIVDADAGSVGEVTVADSTRISTDKVPSLYFNKWGFWSGGTLAERQALWQAARTSAKATRVGDPGPNSKYRNYDDLSWIYWLPATLGVTEDDPRLRSPSWNKFRGYIKELGDGQGGTQTRGGPSFADTNNYQAYNKCASSLDALTPSTVLVPSSVARNSGKYLEQQWARWEPYLATSAVGNAGYPGSSALTFALGGVTQYPLGYLDTTSPASGSPATNPVYRDSYPVATNRGLQGLPIRYNSGSAGAGWDDVKADAGGFVLNSIIDGYSTRVDLEQVMSWYSLPATSDKDASGTTDIQDARFIARKGNRDATPAFGSATGLHAYTDSTASICDSAIGPASATCLDKPSGTTTAAFTLTKTASCDLTGTTTTNDARALEFETGGTCTIGTISNSGTDSNGAAYPSFSDVPNPTVCPAPTTANSTFRTVDNSACAYTVTTVGAAQTCALNGNQTLTINACAPSGGNTVSVAGCALSGASDTVAACAWSGRQTKTVGSCAWVGRVATYNEGAQKYYASGGTCQENGSAAYCTGAAGSTGPYNTAALAIASTTGCTNSVAAGSYNYGGTCTESGSAEECSISGGTAVLGGGYANVNATCSNANSPAAGTYNYGGTCAENGSTSSCQLAAGTSRTIRGVTRTYYTAGNCTNKANSAPTINQSGSYGYGKTCTGTNNVCTPAASSTFTVRGTSYTQVTSCTSALTTGTFNRGGTCSGTKPGCAVVTPYGGSSVYVNPNTWYSTKATCSPPSSAQTYNSNCKGKVKLPPGTLAATTSGTQSACNFTTNTVNINGTNYTNYNTCTDKPDVNSNCVTRFGVSCQTACGAATPTSVTGGATSQSHNYYRTYNFQAGTDYLVHDCKPDDGGSKFMHFTNGTLGTFGNPWSDTNSYASSLTGGVAADNAKKVNMYSVNYLNWKFGPKGPSGRPIGRKTRLQIAKDALAYVISSYAKADPAEVVVRVGVMAFNEAEKDIPLGALAGNSSGAHLIKAVKDLDIAHGNAIVTSINSLLATSATPLTESVYEAYRYFRGEVPLFGGPAYQAKESIKSIPANLRYVTTGIDTSADALTGGKYKSPLTAPCQANMVVLISDGAPENDTSANTEILALPDVDVISIKQGTASEQFEASPGVPFGSPDPVGPPAGDNYILLDELAYYMVNADIRPDLPALQSVSLTTISFEVDSPVMDHATTRGRGVQGLKASSQTDLADAIAKTFNPPLWQPQGGSPATTYNVATGASGDVYLSAFSPTFSKAWLGTIKKYKSGFGETACGGAACGNPNVCITGNPAVTYGSCGQNIEFLEADSKLKDDLGGALVLRKIRPEAVSYWIPTVPPDGGMGDKGGTGQMLVASGSPDTRKLYTFLAGTSLSASLSDAGNAIAIANPAITKDLLGNAGMSDAERDTLISYAQGSNGTATTAWREWPHFDSVHSSPLVDDASLYYLTSDGIVHAVNTADGKERWSFMVEEGLSQISVFKNNPTGEHLEVADGTPVLATIPGATAADDKKLLIFGMRRGGRAYYALDVTVLNAPKFAWKITPTQICNGASCSASAAYAELGQAWSTPVVGIVRAYKDASNHFKPIIVFGGGYDTNQDLATPVVGDSMGRAVFVADAADGALLKKFSTISGGQGYSVPSDVLAIDTTGDSAGTIDRVYVGDMGGRLWRMDLDDRTSSNSPSSWSIVRLANLATATRPIKLFNRPTMATSIYNGQAFDAVFIGGGDSQRPLAYGANDSGAMFMVKDKTIANVATQASTIPSAPNDFVDMTTEFAAAKNLTALVTGALLEKDGYVINLANGEKVTSAAQVFSGALYFGTYLPIQASQDLLAQTCSFGGYGKQYVTDALTGTPLRDSSNIPYFTNEGGRVFGFVAGFGVSLSPKSGGPGLGIYLGNRGVESQAVSKTTAKLYWYSVPDRP